MSAWRRTWRGLGLVLAVALLAGCRTTELVPGGNLGVYKAALVKYHDDGRYERDLARAYDGARAALLAELPGATRPAIVMDIDDTVLSTWEYQRMTEFGRMSKVLTDWQLQGNAPALAPALDFYRFARAHGVAVFFVTGRREPTREATERNLRTAGFTDYARASFKPNDYTEPSAVPYKTAQRAALAAEGYQVLLTIGDQMSDLDGGHARRQIKLPNPFYLLK